MLNQFSRTELLLGHDNMEKLRNARVAVFGIGGVGGFTVEALARSGVGTLDLIDDDRVCLTNINRQIIATRKTIGQYKVDAAKERILDINPDAVVNTYKTFFMPDTADAFDFSVYDYVVDAIDTVTGKIMLVEAAQKAGTPIISSMGAGNKLDPTAFEVADIEGLDFVATGHYAQIKEGRIAQGVDMSKDQSYFLFGLKPEWIARIIFPLGDKIKEELKPIALHELPWLGTLESYKDSQEICY